MNEGLISGALRKSKRHVGSLTPTIADNDPRILRRGETTHLPVNDYERRSPLAIVINRATPFYVRDIVWTGSLWVAISGTQSSTSTDLITWTTPVNLPANGTQNEWAVLEWNGSMLVIVSEERYAPSSSGDGWVYTGYSTNSGASWSSGTSFNLSAVPAKFPVTRPVWTGSAWLFTTSFVSGIFRSTDGINWTRNDTSLFTTAFTGAYGKIVSNGAGTVIASTFTGIMYRSTDHGATWARWYSQGGFMFYDSLDSKFVIINWSEQMGYSTSSDAVTWTQSCVNSVMDFDYSSNSRIVSTPAYYVYPMTQSALAIISKHPNDVNARYWSSGAYIRADPLSTAFHIQYGNSTLVFYPGSSASFNSYGETYYIATVELNASRLFFSSDSLPNITGLNVR